MSQGVATADQVSSGPTKPAEGDRGTEFPNAARQVHGFIANNRTVLRQIATLVLIYLAQRTFRSFMFVCPCLPTPPVKNETLAPTVPYVKAPFTGKFGPGNHVTNGPYHVYRLVKSQPTTIMTPHPTVELTLNRLRLRKTGLPEDAVYRQNAKFRRAYGLTFVLMPALCLFIIKFCISTQPWKLLTGCCTLPFGSRGLKPKAGSRAQDYKAKESKIRHPFCTLKPGQIIKIIITSMMPAFLWLIISFMDGRFLVCSFSHYPCDPTNFHSVEVKAKSQIIGWILVGTIASLFGLIYLPTICGNKNYYEKRFEYIYENREENEMENVTRVTAATVAHEQATKFFNLKKGNKNVRWWETMVPSMHLKQVTAKAQKNALPQEPEPYDRQLATADKGGNVGNLDEDRPFLTDIHH